MECFLNPKSSLRRIAIMGGWGTGKTVVLRLIRDRLKNNTSPKFGVAMINPWTTQSIAEVHSLISRAFEEALGYKDYFSTPSRLSRWLTSLTSIKFGGNTELGFDLQQLFRGESSSREDELVRRINETLRSSGRICVILVDDMERAEPEVIRRVFPLIDILRRVDYCFFVFGIDPIRIARAFKERSASSEQTKGYLDKVFDLQINLSPARTEDIAKICKSWVNEDDTPKLHAAWDSIAQLLPSNPRDAIHFVRDAITQETLFLSRYGPEEQDFIGFFKLRILAMEHPGIVDHIDNQLADEYRDSRNEANLMGERRPELDERVQRNLAAVWSRIRDRMFIPPIKEQRLRNLFEEVLNSPVDLRWACHQYVRLLSLNRQQEQALHLVWQQNAGLRSITEMISMAVPGVQFDDQERIAAQALQTEFDAYESVRSRLLAARGLASANDLLNDALERIGHLITHARFVASSGLDRDFYPANRFSTWVTLMFRGNLERAQVDTSQLRNLEIENSLAISSLLSTHAAYHFARFPTASIIFRESIGDNRNDLIPHIDTVRTSIQERLHRDFITFIRNGRVTQTSFLAMLSVHSLAEVFGDLESWNPRFELSSLRGLEDDMLDNSQIASSLAAIASSLLQAVEYIARTGNGDRVAFTGQTVADHPDYVALVWRMALRSTNDRENLLFRHTTTRNATGENTSITTAQFDAAFPLDLQPGGP